MKKVLSIVLALVMVLAFSGCVIEGEGDQLHIEDYPYFDGEILEVREDNILVKPTGGNEMPSGSIAVSTTPYGELWTPLEVGMQVRIILGGQAKERTVRAMYILDQIKAD